MRKLNLTQIILILPLLTFIIGCHKYDEDSVITLRTPENRLCKSWKMTEVLKNGVLLNIGDTIEKVTYFGYCFLYKENSNIYTFEKNGKFYKSNNDTYYEFKNWEVQSTDSTWHTFFVVHEELKYSYWMLTDKKDSLILTNDKIDSEKSKITKLTKTDLWTNRKINGEEYEFHYIAN